MRWLLLLLFLGLASCAGTKSSVARTSGQRQASPPPAATTPAPANRSGVIVTPAVVLKGKVALVNPAARSAILTFALGQLPRLESRLNVYRSGLKVGEVKITGPRRDINIAADLVAGECQVGDEVRDD